MKRIDWRIKPTFLILSPISGTQAASTIAPGSGVVGMELLDDKGKPLNKYLVYYEGNLYGACNLNTLRQKLTCAAGRLGMLYPTIAHGQFPMEQFNQIGRMEYIEDRWDITIFPCWKDRFPLDHPSGR